MMHVGGGGGVTIQFELEGRVLISSFDHDPEILHGPEQFAWKLVTRYFAFFLPKVKVTNRHFGFLMS